MQQYVLVRTLIFFILCAVLLSTFDFFSKSRNEKQHIQLFYRSPNEKIRKMEELLEEYTLKRLQENRLKQRKRSCYESYEENTIELIPDILTGSSQPNEESIFFHTVACSYDGNLHLNPREACSVEAAARNNPNRKIYVLFLSPVTHQKTEIMHSLDIYENIEFRNVNLWTFGKLDVIKSFINSDIIFESKYLLFYLNMILKYITLWRYGGIHLEMDNVFLKSIKNMPKNFVGLDRNNSTSMNIIAIESSGTGHNIMTKCLQNIEKNFDPNTWTLNGSKVLQLAFENICGDQFLKDENFIKCNEIYVYPKNKFYELDGANLELYFNPNNSEEANKLTENAISLYFMNSISKNLKVKIGEKSAYDVFAEKNCPNIYEYVKKHLDGNFD